MANNPRLSVTLTKRQLELVEKEAARLGISLSDLVRQIVDRECSQWEKRK